ncbi:MAG: DNA mismatch repair endonuclease MutL [Tannerella sp.]|jgi:DNA mismatch repair protein MutL|nr:DNA mismatch repair endonuclease MutL [Tannerella sp.]
MSDIIHLLPDHIANQIAAGEVIQRPASVVKELMENAVDAGAGQIIVNVKEAGRSLVQVIDDGKGMSETDARMAFERHATSKITNAQDLYALRTMGFRGEALASIAAVSQVELRTRLKGAEVGARLSISGSMLDDIKMDACNEGSTFSVRNLFYNVPARRKFLKTNETEFRNIMTEFERVVLVNPQIEFKLFHNDVEVLHLPVSGLRQRIVNVFGKKYNAQLLSMEIATSVVKITGFIGQFNAVKRRGYLNFFFVNGRYMRHPYFHRAIMNAYESLIPAGDIPDYFIYMTLDPASIDINIHPTKTEIKFENEQPVWQILSSAVRETLGKSNAIPSIDFNTDDKIDIPVYNPASAHHINAPKVELNTRYNPFRDSSSPGQSWEQLYAGFEHDRMMPSEKPFAEDIPEEQAEEQESLFSDVANPCFQYKNRYIITPLKSGLVLIDQRRAHIRILYEQYMSNIKLRKSVSQQMLFPEIVEFTPAEAAMIPSVTDEIQWLGFDISPIGDNCYSINGMPAGVREGNPALLLKEIVRQVMESESVQKKEKTGLLALSLAKSAAIRPGKSLTLEEMEAIVAALFSMEANNLTPDGKVIMSVITDDELVKRFKA